MADLLTVELALTLALALPLALPLPLPLPSRSPRPNLHPDQVRHHEWEIVVSLDRATDRGATMLPMPSDAEMAAAAAALLPPPLRCDPDGVLSLACLEEIFTVRPLGLGLGLGLGLR